MMSCCCDQSTQDGILLIPDDLTRDDQAQIIQTVEDIRTVHHQVREKIVRDRVIIRDSTDWTSFSDTFPDVISRALKIKFIN